ncbi:hypothetical protein [Niabella drilacis]|uniref:Uncharacterized protein n=1 Tax=Niabella drilacis (strain DSM 25811 / CCM 8410 / CCUG 62505 / LMG 26954 / E90) TaxID=1285928 RepID=A0A1G6Q1V1_NIADE|nr:hypothetical protein [Niabella drilacis]SDC85615.1 hypothetical protein SAMN04487894_104224 [Niabella drilacis]
MATKKTAAKKTAAKKSGKQFTAPLTETGSTIRQKARVANEPVLMPMQEDAGLTAWNNNTRIVQTWGKAENNNAWLNITGLGWKKIKESNTQALLALLMIGAHGRDKNSLVNVRTESDNKVYELYVW